MTKQLKVRQDGRLTKEDLNQAVEFLRAGELVAFPTETVYGLGADATNPLAIEKIYLAKGRPSDNPLIAHVGDYDQLKKLVKYIPPYVEKLIHHFSPGPITYILKHNHVCSKKVTAGLETIAVRIPSHPVALQLLKACEFPVAAPSANLSGKPSPTSATHVLKDLAGKISVIIDAGSTDLGLESTVLDCTGDVPVILRDGSITGEMIEKVLNVALKQSEQHTIKTPKSPGLKYKHYAPAIPLILIEGNKEKIKTEILTYQALGKKVGLLLSDQTANKLGLKSNFKLGKDIEEIASNLYNGLRSFEKANYDVIITESFEKNGLGIAVMDRLTRAATKII